MTWHYFLIGICIACIIFYQIKIYLRTNEKRRQFDNIFPENSEEVWIVLKKEGVQIVSRKQAELNDVIQKCETELKKLATQQQTVQSAIKRYTGYYESAVAEGQPELMERFTAALETEKQKQSTITRAAKEWRAQKSDAEKQIEELSNLRDNLKYGTRAVIIDSINKYLEKNKDSVTDFNLIRDIIDRNCDSIEEEIQTQIPMPLYFGLMGTMLGILIGVVALVASGSLGNLLSTFTPPAGVMEGSPAYEAAKKAFEETATSGVTALFGGVALAMISSIFGILLTTIGSIRTKNIKANVESKKHAFISWLQAELLPKISTDFSSALIQLGHDLSGFNSTFSSNANLLRQTIADVSQATMAQSQLLQTIERLDIARIAKANVAVYDRLQNCTQEIASLANDLHVIQENIKGLGTYMENGINEYERRHTFIQDASGKVDLALQKGQEQLSNEASVLFNKYNELLNMLYVRSEATTKELAAKYDAQAESLHKAIVEKLTDVKQLENELKNLVAVKSGIANLEKATQDQNRKIDNLTSAIRELAQVKVTGGATSVSMQLPTLYKVLIITTASIVSLAGLAFLVLQILGATGVL